MPLSPWTTEPESTDRSHRGKGVDKGGAERVVLPVFVRTKFSCRRKLTDYMKFGAFHSVFTQLPSRIFVTRHRAHTLRRPESRAGREDRRALPFGLERGELAFRRGSKR
jgi:hypothetical protein